MTELKNPFAKRNNRIITIYDLSEDEKGRNCSCRCPECDGPFLARMGDKRTWHFAHSGEPCNKSKQITNSVYQLFEQAILLKSVLNIEYCY